VKLLPEEIPEDDATAWKERLMEGKEWGGRGYGGRGEYAGKVNTIRSNIHLSNVSVSLPNGTELLQNTVMDITANHRYALVGRNGVGKSTLLSRLGKRLIPGMPEMRILLVQQQVDGSDMNPVEVLLEADVHRLELLAEETKLESSLESAQVNEMEIEQVAQRLSDVAVELDAIGADTAESRAKEVLKGLQFTEKMLRGPTLNLSGGWRMRLALARALFVKSDLLLLDECSNHLDLQGLDWLIKYLTRENDRTMIIVSHDRSFLDAVCTDVIRMDHEGLTYHSGNYSEYERQLAEKATRQTQILDAAERQRSKADAFVQKQQAMANKKSADPNKQRQAKMIKEKKMERIGNYREDGKRYKNFSLKKLDESQIRLAQKVQIRVDEPVINMRFPAPAWPPGISPGDAVVRAETCSLDTIPIT
jgi:ATPase subunit of ABC transporter with duplicated ATPase domains